MVRRLLTAAAIPAVRDVVPGLVLNGNKASCGKSVLIDFIGRVILGKNVAITACPGDAEEAGKMATAMRVAGKSMTHLDNATNGGTYGNAKMDSALTTYESDDRIFGHNNKTTGEIRCTVFYFISGNNLSPKDDAFRRWMICNINTDLAKPHRRNDIKIRDLRGYIQNHRGELVRDVLTIFRAHALAGRPQHEWGPLASFESWDRIVRSAIWWLTGRDCTSTQEEAAISSPEHLEKLALFEAWMIETPKIPYCRGIGLKGCLVSAVAAAVKSNPGSYPLLYEAFSKRPGTRGEMPDSIAMGNFIRGLKNTNHDGLIFREGGKLSRAVLWKVHKTNEYSPESQDQAESESQSIDFV